MKKLFPLALFILSFVFSFNILAGVKVIAHRGGSSLAPENTLAAFKKAIDVKADYFELDVQLSSDDSLMIMHDNTVDRTTNGTGAISSMTYAKLRTFDAGSKFSSAYAGEKIPTLAEALQTARNSANNIGVVVEIKSTDPTLPAKTVKMIQDWKMTSRVIVSSFYLDQLTQVKTIDPTIKVQVFATVTNAVIDQMTAIKGEWVGDGGTPTKELLAYSHSKNIQYNCWTINTASQMVQLIALGVDAITTDYPDVLLGLNDTTRPSDVVLNTPTVKETQVTLSWQPAVDLESGITGYQIFRDVNPLPTTLLATVANVTGYDDQTNTESKTFYYRVKAVNAMGLTSLNYSNEVSIKTLADATKPVVNFVSSSGDSSTVVVEFSKGLDKTTAETKTNYTINKSVVVLAAKLTVDLKSVILTTSNLLDTTYTLTVKNVKDLASTPNVIVTSTTIFRHKNSPLNVIAYYKLDDFQVVQNDSVVYDSSPFANNGIMKNGVMLSEGLVGNGFKFDGIDDYVQFNSSPSFDINGSAVSVSLWAKLDYLPGDMPGGFGPMFDSDGDEYNLYEDKANNELRFKVTTTVSAERPGIPAASLKTGEWLHVVGVYNGSQVMIYLNGILKDAHTLSGAVKTGQVPMLGKSVVNGVPTYFKGSLDNVQVFNRALSSAEIDDMYKTFRTSGIDPRPSDVVLKTPTVKNTEVTLEWLPAATSESTMMGYEIYRDAAPAPETLYTTVNAKTTSFVDTTNTEMKTFFYRIKAKNTDCLKSANFSNEVSATTGTDNNPPIVLYITSHEGSNKVVVEFNERVDKAAAENAANYSINNGIQVINAKLALNSKSVRLTTSPMAEGAYYLTIKNIKDRAASPNTIANSTYIFNSKSLSPNLVAYYAMDNTRIDSLFDLTANNNHGVFMNSTTMSAGLLGNSILFNGVNNYVQLAASPSYNMTGGQVSVSVWTKMDFLPSEMIGGYGPLFDSDGDNYVIYADKGNKELRFKVSTSGGAARPGIPQSDLVSGEWFNVVGVYDGANATIYLNGIKKGTLPLTGTITTGQIANLGRNASTGTIAYFQGNIDNVAVYNKALSQTEIVELYTNYRTAVTGPVVPVELISFNTSISAGKVALHWETATEKNNSGFEIEWSSNKETFSKIGFVPGCGTSSLKHSYSFSDVYPLTAKSYYRLKQIDYDGSYNYSNIVEAGIIAPASFSMSQNYPNPFNPSTTIKYQLPSKERVIITIFNSIGEKIKTIADGIKEAGYYTIQWNGRDELNNGVAAGIYFYRIQAGGFVDAKKMIFLK